MGLIRKISRRKRKRTHGFLKRMRTPGGRRTVNRRRQKGRKSLTPAVHRR